MDSRVLSTVVHLIIGIILLGLRLALLVKPKVALSAPVCGEMPARSSIPADDGSAARVERHMHAIF